MKPTIYLDTNIISALYYSGHDAVTIARRVATWEWWNTEKQHFSLVASSFTEAELTSGTFKGQATAIATIRRISYLQDSGTVRDCAKKYMSEKLVPDSKIIDAVHLAFASVYSIDYLLSWNHSHLSNEETQNKLEVVNDRLGWRTPLLRSPLTVPRRALGQVIRRKS